MTYNRYKKKQLAEIEAKEKEEERKKKKAEKAEKKRLEKVNKAYQKEWETYERGKEQSYQTIFKYFKGLDQEAKNSIRQKILKYANKSKNRQEFLKIRKKINFILSKKARGIAWTRQETILFETFVEVLIQRNIGDLGLAGGKKGNDLNQWTKIHSSWLLRGKFWINKNQKNGRFYVVMPTHRKAGRVIATKTYLFGKFPLEDFLKLVTVTSHAGTLWWRDNMWKFSKNYGARALNADALNRKNFSKKDWDKRMGRPPKKKKRGKK